MSQAQHALRIARREGGALPTQKYKSAGTSQRQVSATAARAAWKPGTHNFDIGGGKYDDTTHALAKHGVTNHVYDPFNRSPEHNDAVLRHVKGRPPETATVNSVLNVIHEPEIRSHVIGMAARSIHPAGQAHFLIYEGDRSGQGRVTKTVKGAPESWQNHLPASAYIGEIGQHFGNVARAGNLITASEPRQDESTPAPLWRGGAAGHAVRIARDVGGMIPQSEDVRIDNPITAYHGTPHDFDRFDTSKIGTGEGNQTYGHGLYFAQNEKVARGYRDSLSQTHPDTHFVFDGKHHHRDEVDDYAGGPEYLSIGAMMDKRFDPQAAREHMLENQRYYAAKARGENEESDEDVLNWLRHWGQDTPEELAKHRQSARTYAQRTVDDYKHALAWFDAHGHRIQQPEMADDAGHMYQVALHAPEEHFLDWDAPMNAQHPHVQHAVKTALAKAMRDAYDGPDAVNGNMVGRDGTIKYTHIDDVDQHEGASVHGMLRKVFGSAGTADELKSHGIPGIKYWDAGSRGNGQGTRNFVVFDPRHIEVTRKYARGGEVYHGYAPGHRTVPIMPMSPRTNHVVASPTTSRADAISIARRMSGGS